MLNDAENEIGGYWEIIYIRLCMMKSNNEYHYYSDEDARKQMNIYSKYE